MKIFSFKKILTSLLALLILISVFCAVPVYADGDPYTAEFSVTTSDPEDNIPDGTRFALVIEGQPHAPLPEPARISADAKGTYSFAPVEFTEPGNYKYTVRQISPNDNKLIPDTTVYEILVTVIRNDSGELEGGYTISNQSENKKYAAISFTNDYKKAREAKVVKITKIADIAKIVEVLGVKTKNGSKNVDSDYYSTYEHLAKNSGTAPPTGEPLSPAFGGLALSGVLFVLFLAARRRQSRSSRKEADSE